MLIQFIKHPMGKKTFKFFNHRAEQEGFIESVSKVWGNSVPGCRSFQITKKVKRLKPILKDIFQVNQLQALVMQVEDDLRNAQNELHKHPYDPELSSKEYAAADMLRKAKNDQGTYLSQLAKLNWLEFGDENSRYFHQSIRQRQIVNQILLLNDNGVLIIGIRRIQESFVSFYQQLLCNNLHCRRRIDMNVIREGPLLENSHYEQLSHCFSTEEIRNALWSILETKSPGLDGYNSKFYKAACSVIGDDVVEAVRKFFRNGKPLQA